MSDSINHREPTQPVPNNPAGRLLAFLNDLSAASNGGGNIRDVIARMYAVPTEDRARLLQIVSQIAELPKQLGEAIEATDELPDDPYLEVVPEAENWMAVFDQMLGGLSLPQPTVLTMLKLCDASLSKFNPEPVPSGDDLARVRAEADELLVDITTADFDVDLRLFLADQISGMITALDDFRITGVAPTRRVVAEFIGQAALHKESIEQLDEDSPSKEMFDRVWRFAERLSVLAALTPTTVALFHAGFKALGAG